MEIRAIKTDKDYKEALTYVESLIDKGVEKNSIEAEKMDILVTLIQDYESRMFPVTIPDPIDALEFVMEQRSLSHEDLVPYIGSRSKVSEVLSRKRPLSLNMIKALHEGLGIPAKTLLNQSRSSDSNNFDYENFPIHEMIKRGYIIAKEEIQTFLSVLEVNTNISALLSRTFYVRSPRSMNQYSLHAWMAHVVNKAELIKLKTSFEKNLLTKDFLKKVVDLSDEENSIFKVQALLQTIGITLIVEPNMPQTYLDGAAIMIKNENPIIGLTVRHDRLDNFWFTLLHELAHIFLHYGKGTNLFYDDVEVLDNNDIREKEADKLALDMLIPEDKWKNSPASIVPSPEAAKMLAENLSIHPAIVAGRMRYERKHYHFLNSLVGKGEVQKLFPEVNWP